MPLHVLMFTYALPYVVLWWLAAYACIGLLNYSRLIKGAIYRPLFHKLASGIIIVFIATFIAQLLVITHLTMEKFSPLLIIVYLLLMLSVYGFILIYQGAASLHQIEADRA